MLLDEETSCWKLSDSSFLFGLLLPAFSRMARLLLVLPKLPDTQFTAPVGFVWEKNQAAHAERESGVNHFSSLVILLLEALI